MGRCAGLHPDQAARLFGKPRQHLRAPQRATNHQGGGLIDPMHLKDVFGDIHTDRANLSHGWLPLSWSLPTQLWHSDAVRGPSTPSFRGAAQAASPEPIFQRPVFMGSGLAASRRRGMTMWGGKCVSLPPSNPLAV